MKSCLNCGDVVENGEWYDLTHPIVPVTGAPNISATVQEGLEELFQKRLEVQDTDGLCERCFHLLSVSLSMKRTSSNALEQFISFSSNVSVKQLDRPLLYDHLSTEASTKLILQEGVNWYSVIADASKSSVVCYGSSQAIEYVNSIQDQINGFFTYCTENGSQNSEIVQTSEVSVTNDNNATDTSKETRANGRQNKIQMFEPGSKNESAENLANKIQDNMDTSKDIGTNDITGDGEQIQVDSSDLGTNKEDSPISRNLSENEGIEQTSGNREDKDSITPEETEDNISSSLTTDPNQKEAFIETGENIEKGNNSVVENLVSIELTSLNKTNRNNQNSNNTNNNQENKIEEPVTEQGPCPMTDPYKEQKPVHNLVDREPDKSIDRASKNRLDQVISKLRDRQNSNEGIKLPNSIGSETFDSGLVEEAGEITVSSDVNNISEIDLFAENSEEIVCSTPLASQEVKDKETDESGLNESSKTNDELKTSQNGDIFTPPKISDTKNDDVEKSKEVFDKNVQLNYAEECVTPSKRLNYEEQVTPEKQSSNVGGSVMQKVIERCNSFNNELTPEKQQETMETSKSAVESYKKIIEEIKSKKITQKGDNSDPHGKETQKKGDELHVFESLELDQYIAENSKFSVSDVLKSPKEGKSSGKISSNAERLARMSRIKENIRARNSVKHGSSKIVHHSGTKMLEKSDIVENCNNRNLVLNPTKTALKNTEALQIITNPEQTSVKDNVTSPTSSAIKDGRSCNVVLSPTQRKGMSQPNKTLENLDVTKTNDHTAEKSDDAICESADDSIKVSSAPGTESDILKYPIEINTVIINEIRTNNEDSSSNVTTVTASDGTTVSEKTENTHNPKSLTSPQYDCIKSPWSLKINIRKKPKPLKLKTKFGDIRKTLDGEFSNDLDKVKDPLSPEIVFEQMQQTFYSKSLKRKENKKDSLSVLTKDILMNLQPVVSLVRLPAEKIEQFKHSSSTQKSVPRKPPRYQSKIKSNQQSKVHPESTTKDQTENIQDKPTSGETENIQDEILHEEQTNNTITIDRFYSNSKTSHVSSSESIQSSDVNASKDPHRNLLESKTDMTDRDEDEETVVSFPDETDVSFIEEGADVDQYFSDDPDNLFMPSISEKIPVDDTQKYLNITSKSDENIYNKNSADSMDLTSVATISSHNMKDMNSQSENSEEKTVTNKDVQVTDKIDSQNKSMSNLSALKMKAILDSTKDNMELVSETEDIETGHDIIENSSVTEVKANHSTPVTELEASHSTPVTELEASHSTPVTELEASHSTLVTELEASHSTPVTELEASHSTPVTELEASHSTPVTELEASHSIPVTELEVSHSTPVTEFEMNDNRPVTELEMNEHASVTELATDVNTLETELEIDKKTLVTLSITKDNITVTEEEANVELPVTELVTNSNTLVTELVTNSNTLITELVTNDNTSVTELDTTHNISVTEQETNDDTSDLETNENTSITELETNVMPSVTELGVDVNASVTDFETNRNMLVTEQEVDPTISVTKNKTQINKNESNETSDIENFDEASVKKETIEKTTIVAENETFDKTLGSENYIIKETSLGDKDKVEKSLASEDETIDNSLVIKVETFEKMPGYENKTVENTSVRTTEKSSDPEKETVLNKPVVDKVTMEKTLINQHSNEDNAQINKLPVTMEMKNTGLNVVNSGEKFNEVFTCPVCQKKYTDEFAFHFHRLNKHQSEQITSDVISKPVSSQKSVWHEDTPSVSRDIRKCQVNVEELPIVETKTKKRSNKKNKKTGIRIKLKNIKPRKTSKKQKLKIDSDLETYESSNKDEDDGLSRKNIEMQKRFRILKSSQWLDQHHNKLSDESNIESDSQSERSFGCKTSKLFHGKILKQTMSKDKKCTRTRSVRTGFGHQSTKRKKKCLKKSNENVYSESTGEPETEESDGSVALKKSTYQDKSDYLEHTIKIKTHDNHKKKCFIKTGNYSDISEDEFIPHKTVTKHIEMKFPAILRQGHMNDPFIFPVMHTNIPKQTGLKSSDQQKQDNNVSVPMATDLEHANIGKQVNELKRTNTDSVSKADQMPNIQTRGSKKNDNKQTVSKEMEIDNNSLDVIGKSNDLDISKQVIKSDTEINVPVTKHADNIFENFESIAYPSLDNLHDNSSSKQNTMTVNQTSNLSSNFQGQKENSSLTVETDMYGKSNSDFNMKEAKKERLSIHEISKPSVIGNLNQEQTNKALYSGTIVRKDIRSCVMDFPFKRPAPIPEKRMKSAEVDVKQRNNVNIVPNPAPFPKKQNVMFVNLRSKKARELEQKRKEEEAKRKTKKQNVPFLFTSMFKKRKKPSDDTSQRMQEQACQDNKVPPPTKVIKLEEESIVQGTNAELTKSQIDTCTNIRTEAQINTQMDVITSLQIDTRTISPIDTRTISPIEVSTKSETDTRTFLQADVISNLQTNTNSQINVSTNLQSDTRTMSQNDPMMNQPTYDGQYSQIFDIHLDNQNIAGKLTSHQNLVKLPVEQAPSCTYFFETDITSPMGGSVVGLVEGDFMNADADRLLEELENQSSLTQGGNRNEINSGAHVYNLDYTEQSSNGSAVDLLGSIPSDDSSTVNILGNTLTSNSSVDILGCVSPSTGITIDNMQKSTKEVDNLVLKDNKRLVVSLHKLSEKDILKQRSSSEESLPDIVGNNWQCMLCGEQYISKQEVTHHVVMAHSIPHEIKFDSKLNNYICQMDGVKLTEKSSPKQENELKHGDKENIVNSKQISYNTTSETPCIDVEVMSKDYHKGQSQRMTDLTHLRKPIPESTPLPENNQWKCLVCNLYFRLKIDVIQHIKMKHKNISTMTNSYISEPLTVTIGRIQSESTGTENSYRPKPSQSTLGKVMRTKDKKKSKRKDTTELLIISSKKGSIEPDPFIVPLSQPEENRSILSVKWHCKLCPNWYRLRKCCLQHVQKEHNIRGNWARFYFHNSQQVINHPSMEICTSPHIDVNAYQFCIVCGRSFVNDEEVARHMRRNHAYIPEHYRDMCMLNKLEGRKVVVACDVFSDLHIYTVGKKSARLIDKDYVREIFDDCIFGVGDFKESDMVFAQQLKWVLYENAMITLDNQEIEHLKYVHNNFEVNKIVFEEDFQWERKKLGVSTDSDESKTEDTDSENEVVKKPRVSTVASLSRCHTCNITFPDRISLDKHNLTHKVKVKFSCRLCNKFFKKIFILLQHLEIKHSQPTSTYFQFVMEHDDHTAVVGSGTETGDEEAYDSSSTLNSDQDRIVDIISSDDQELGVSDMETNETKACFVCGKTFDSRIAIFTHMKEKHMIYNRKCLHCNKTFISRVELQKHFGTVHDIDFVVDVSDQLARCYICDVVVENRTALKQHLRKHDGKGFNCNLCKMKYTSGSSLRFHKRTVHWNLEGTRSCKICDKIFTNLKGFEQHMLNHFYDYLGPLKCTKCDLVLKNKRLYNQHKASHKTSTICEICGKVCADQNSLKHHLAIHDVCVKCDICGKLLNKYSVKNHMSRVHSDQDKVSCHICGKTVSQAYIKFHIEEMHNNKNKKHKKKDDRICKVCGKNFLRPGLLKQHMVVHTGERPYVCEVCGKDFGHKSALNTHYLVHKGYKPHKCLHCEESFWLISQCKTHMLSHHGIFDPNLKHKCTYCDKRFKQVGALRFHLDEIHSEKLDGPKYYPCRRCKKEFKYRKNLKIHMSLCGEKAPPGRPAHQLDKKTFQEIKQNSLELSDNSQISQSEDQKAAMELEQQYIVQEDSGDVTYQTIYIQSDPNQVYVQDVANQDEIVVQNENDELIVALPDDCGEYNVDFLSSSNDIIQDADIGYAEIVVQNQ